jgi:DNA-binding response OmpR family regulator
MQTVLIVEDEVSLRSSMARGLSKLEGLSVIEASTVSGGIAAIEAHRPQLIVSDLDLPDGSGIEFLSVLDRRGLAAPVIFASAHVATFRDQIPQRATVMVKEKPLPLEELRRIVKDSLGKSQEPGLPFTVEEWVQLACMGRHNILIELSVDDRARGSIVVKNGEVWAAQDAEGQGEDAFRRLAFDRTLAISCRTLNGDSGGKNIERPWMNLLLDSARQADEELREIDGFGSTDGFSGLSGDIVADLADPIEEPEPPFAEIDGGEELEAAALTLPSASPSLPDLESSPPPLPESFESLMDLAIQAILKKDYALALRAFSSAQRLKPGHRTVESNLRRLRELGY